MEAPIEQQESMFTEPEEFAAPEYSDELLDSVPEPISDEESEAIFKGEELAGVELAGAEPAGEEQVTAGQVVQPAETVAQQSAPEEASTPEQSSESSLTKSPEELTPLSADDFSALEERVLRAVGLVRTERQARIAAEDRAAQLASQIEIQTQVVEQLKKEIELLRVEREQVRQRVERLLVQLDALEL